MNENTKTKLLESISGLIDGECSESELEQLLSSVDQEEIIESGWKDFHRIGSVLRKQAHTGIDISAAVSEAVANDKPEEQLLESLSALVDGEASELELRRLLKHQQSADGLDRHWSGYQTIGHAAKREPQMGIDISSAVSAAIANESKPTVDSGTSTKRFFKPLSQLAVAASVTGLALFGINQYQIAQTDVSDNATIAEVESIDAEIESTDKQINSDFAPPAGFEIYPQTSLVSTNSEVKNISEEVRTQIQFDEEALSDHLNESVEQHSQDASELSQDFQPLLRVPVEE